jgi:hypothetical protein
MKTFHEAFKDKIDMYLGTAVIDEKAYNEICSERCPSEIRLLVELSVSERAAMPSRMVEHLECLRDTKRPVDLLYCLRACLQELDRRNDAKPVVSKLIAGAFGGDK